jgi:O-antigen/teichoic acid export membrane protein
MTPGALRFRRLAKEGIWVVSGQAASVAASLVLVRVLTAFLDPTQYGDLALALTLGALICQVAFTGAMPGILRYYTVAADKGDVHQYFVESRRMMLFGTFAALVLSMLLMIGLVVAGRAESLALVAVAIVFSILGSYDATFSMIQNAARQRVVVAFHSAAGAWLKVLFVAALLSWTVKSSVVVVSGYLLSVLLVLASQSVFIKQLGARQPRDGSGGANRWSGRIWFYSRPFVVFNVFTWLQASADRWALETFATTQDVGLYAVLMQLGYAPISMLTTVAITFISPIIFQRSGDGTEHGTNGSGSRLAWQLTMAALAVTAVAFVLALCFHEWIFRLFVAKEYRVVSNLLPWTVLAGGLFAAGQVISLKLMSGTNTHVLLAPKIGTSIAGTLLSFAGAHVAGLEGVVFALVAFSILHLLWVGFLGAPVRKNPSSAR